MQFKTAIILTVVLMALLSCSEGKFLKKKKALILAPFKKLGKLVSYVGEGAESVKDGVIGGLEAVSSAGGAFFGLGGSSEAGSAPYTILEDFAIPKAPVFTYEAAPVAPLLAYGPPPPKQIYGAPPPKQVFVQPAPVQVLVEQKEEPLLNTADLVAVWEALRDRAVRSNPLFNYFNRPEEVKIPVPEYKFVPSLGFSHYNNFKYIPVVANPAPAPHYYSEPAPLHYPEPAPQHYPAPVPAPPPPHGPYQAADHA